MQSIAKYKREYKELFRLGSPILLSQLGIIILAFSDTLMVGRYGVNELASAAFVNSVYMIPNVMLMGLSGGVTPLVGALFSKGKHGDVGRITRASLQVNLWMAVLETLLMAMFYFCLPYFGQPTELMELIRTYYLVLLFVPIPMALFNVFMQMSNGITYTSLPMWITLAAIMLNIAGNWVLIYGHCGMPRLGLMGAGIATVLARFVALLAIWVAFVGMRRFKEIRKGFRTREPLAEARIKVWRTSWPVMLQNGCECFLWSFGAVVC